MRGRWHGGAVTDEVGHLRLRGAVHLISRLRRQLPLIGEAIGVRKFKASPSRGGGSAKPRRRGCCKFATTSQSASQTAPLGGEPFSLRRDNPSGAPRQLPLTRGALGADAKKPPLVKGRCRAKRGGEVTPRKKVTYIRISTAPSIGGSRSKATSYKFGTPVSGGAL